MAKINLLLHTRGGATKLQTFSGIRRAQCRMIGISCLKRVADVAAGDDEVVSPILEAVREYTTVGEICDTLKEVWGAYKDVTR